jgi:hypothetical protein
MQEGCPRVNRRPPSGGDQRISIDRSRNARRGAGRGLRNWRRRPGTGAPEVSGFSDGLRSDTGRKPPRLVAGRPAPGEHVPMATVRVAAERTRRSGGAGDRWPLPADWLPILTAEVLGITEGVTFAALERVEWFNHRRLLEPIGNIPSPPKRKPASMPSPNSSPCWRNPNKPASANAARFKHHTLLPASEGGRSHRQGSHLNVDAGSGHARNSRRSSESRPSPCQ